MKIEVWADIICPWCGLGYTVSTMRSRSSPTVTA